MSVWTGVSVDYTARHVDPMGLEGEHGHTWRVTAWFDGEPFRDARALRMALETALAAWPPVLPPELWSAENMAAQLCCVLANCIGVDIDRPGYHARARL